MSNDKRIKHGYSTRGAEHPLYKIFKNIKTRCYNKNRINYPYYGGRGITICEEWLNSPLLFIEWALSHNWCQGLEIDRINYDGNYEPSNCRLVDKFIQTQNTRRLVITNKTGYRGVSVIGNKFKAQISMNNKKYHLGHYNTDIEAALAYDEFVLKNGSYHTLNFPR